MQQQIWRLKSSQAKHVLYIYSLECLSGINKHIVEPSKSWLSPWDVTYLQHKHLSPPLLAKADIITKTPLAHAGHYPNVSLANHPINYMTTFYSSHDILVLPEEPIKNWSPVIFITVPSITQTTSLFHDYAKINPVHSFLRNLLEHWADKITRKASCCEA